MQLDIKKIADAADMIINGYAYTQEGKYIRILNLNKPNHAAVIYDNKIVETNMDDIENQIVLDYYLNNKQFMVDQPCPNIMNLKYVAIVRKIRAFIKEHYKEMYLKWIEIADTGFYGEKQ